MKIFLVGSSGFLGGLISSELKKNHLETIRLSRSFDKSEFFGSVSGDILIDAGFPRSLSQKKVVEEYFQNLEYRLKFCGKKKVKYLYLGSLAGNSPINSKYGEMKREAEKLVLACGGKILRFGLAVNSNKPGGRHAELVSIVKGLKILILPSAEFFPITFTHTTLIIEKIRLAIKNFSKFPNDLTVKSGHSNLNEFARYYSSKKTFTLPNWLTNCICLVIRFVPLGKLGNIKSIAYRETLIRQYHSDLELFP